ncbi:MAG TPA: DUF2062 domain-containing protein [Nitrospirales bacterium]|nr:DUF2062 domain-containing protein [Nitrospiraceae bacterium]HNP27572.1 DUF2062 domain-containing protein [Nitrospirales bacterium]
MVTLESVRQQLTQVLHLRETPHRTALAFALGVFIAFAPHYLLHTASVVFCAWAFRLNFLALLLGSFINNPWTLVPILAASLYTGLLLVGTASSTTIEWEQMRVDNMFDMLSPYLVPFIVGACTLAIVGSLIAYPIMRWAITRYRGFKNS